MYRSTLAPMASFAAGPAGALYITDDAAGRVWKVTYGGGASALRPTAANAGSK